MMRWWCAMVRVLGSAFGLGGLSLSCDRLETFHVEVVWHVLGVCLDALMRQFEADWGHEQEKQTPYEAWMVWSASEKTIKRKQARPEEVTRGAFCVSSGRRECDSIHDTWYLYCDCFLCCWCAIVIVIAMIIVIVMFIVIGLWIAIVIGVVMFMSYKLTPHPLRVRVTN